MASFKEQLKKANSLTASKIETDLFKFLKSIEPELLQKEKDRLFNESKDIFGQPIGFYSYATEVLSKGKKKKGEPFTSFDTGDFFKGFYMQEVSGVIRFGSKDSKTNTILNSDNWLSNEIFGLSDIDLKEIISQRLLPFLIENTRKKLDL